jgi:hypothetical protein
MTPLLLALGVYCTIAVVIFGLANGKNIETERANFIDKAFFLHFAGVVYFWIKASDIWFGWSA